jgi:hypothetical protein
MEPRAASAPSHCCALVRAGASSMDAWKTTRPAIRPNEGGSPAWGQLASRPAEVVRFVRSGIRYCASGSDREPRIREARSSSTTTPTVKYLCGADQPWTVAGSFMRRDTVEYLLTTNAPSFVLRNHCVVRARKRVELREVHARGTGYCGY